MIAVSTLKQLTHRAQLVQSAIFIFITYAFIYSFCSAWRIPANWKSGDALVKLGEQVVHETREPAYNGDGVISGTSSSTDTWSTANYRAEGIVDGTTDVPLNERGISGALLSASFDSLPDEDFGFNDDNGRLKAASSPTGAFIEKAPDPDSLKLWENSQADNFAVDRKSVV